MSVLKNTVRHRIEHRSHYDFRAALYVEKKKSLNCRSEAFFDGYSYFPRTSGLTEKLSIHFMLVDAIRGMNITYKIRCEANRAYSSRGKFADYVYMINLV